MIYDDIRIYPPILLYISLISLSLSLLLLTLPPPLHWRCFFNSFFFRYYFQVLNLFKMKNWLSFHGVDESCYLIFRIFRGLLDPAFSGHISRFKKHHYKCLKTFLKTLGLAWTFEDSGSSLLAFLFFICFGGIYVSIIL